MTVTKTTLQPENDAVVSLGPAESQDSPAFSSNANRALARSHYENFSVGSILLPKPIREDLYNIYAFCRLADDLADEPVGGVSRSDELLRWEQRLDAIENGREVEPSFAPLRDTIRRRCLLTASFRDLLHAFQTDLIKVRYETWEDLHGYAVLSANPVGRLVLAVCGQSGSEKFAMSDKICTALQFANHWQDVHDDYLRGRIYIPKKFLETFGVSESDIANQSATAPFRKMMKDLVDQTEVMFIEGKSLVKAVGMPLSPQLYLYWGGGMAALDAIRQVDYDVLNNKCRVGTKARIKLASGALLKWIGGRFG